ncbi:MAG TPA: DNA methyltransferase, partial [Syntrophales bacterium]|nr:DNA methyltransferase [Syntrophales bacterium]
MIDEKKRGMRKAKIDLSKRDKRKPKVVKRIVKSDKTSAPSFVREPEVEYQIKFKARTNKAIDESWDFRKSNTKEYTHCFHPYPAMMIPQVARRIIENYGNKSEVLFDPYCGTGTSLVEANLRGINAIGTDINPLARLIASTKTTKIDIQVLDLFLQDFMNYFFSISFQIEKIKSVI